MNILNVISLLLFLIGSFLMFLAGLGLVRLPDVFLLGNLNKKVTHEIKEH